MSVIIKHCHQSIIHVTNKANEVMVDWNMEKLSKILSFNTKDPYFLSLCHQSIIYTCEQQTLNVTILYNAHLKANEVMDDWNIEMIKDPRYLN